MLGRLQMQILSNRPTAFHHHHRSQPPDSDPEQLPSRRSGESLTSTTQNTADGAQLYCTVAQGL